MQMEPGVLIAIGAYLVTIGLWSGKLHMTVTAQGEKIRSVESDQIERLKQIEMTQELRMQRAEARIDSTTDTLARILSELTRLTTLIEERTSKKQAP